MSKTITLNIDDECIINSKIQSGCGHRLSLTIDDSNYAWEIYLVKEDTLEYIWMRTMNKVFINLFKYLSRYTKYGYGNISDMIIIFHDHFNLNDLNTWIKNYEYKDDPKEIPPIGVNIPNRIQIYYEDIDFYDLDEIKLKITPKRLQMRIMNYCNKTTNTFSIYLFSYQVVEHCTDKLNCTYTVDGDENEIIINIDGKIDFQKALKPIIMDFSIVRFRTK